MGIPERRCTWHQGMEGEKCSHPRRHSDKERPSIEIKEGVLQIMENAPFSIEQPFRESSLLGAVVCEWTGEEKNSRVGKNSEKMECGRGKCQSIQKES